MTIFVPCIDIYNQKVVQIVGSSLSSDNPIITNFTSSHSPSFYASLYSKLSLIRGHVIKLGPNNDQSAIECLATYPNSLQIGGQVDDTNALQWISHGAQKVILTSFIFPNAKLSLANLISISNLITPQRLVIDLSCKRVNNQFIIATNKWQTLTDTELNKDTLDIISKYCSEFLIHSADVEGKCNGIDQELVSKLGEWVTIPCTYAGGARNINDLELVKRLSNGKVDLTFGSALDIFGGTGVKLMDLVAWNSQQQYP